MSATSTQGRLSRSAEIEQRKYGGYDRRHLLRTVLWLLLHRKRFLVDFIERLSADFWDSPEAQWLAAFGIWYYQQHDTPASRRVLVSVLDAHEEREELEQEGVTRKAVLSLYDSLEVVEKADYPYFWDVTDEFCRDECLGAALRDAASALTEQGTEEALRVIDRARASLDPTTGNTLEVFGEMQEALVRIGAREAEDEYIATGLPRLDRKMQGGLAPGELACFIAPTGRGKTMWLCFVAAFAFIQGVDVAYYTLEIDRDEVFTRIIASGSGVSINEIKAWAAMGRHDPDVAGRAFVHDPSVLIGKLRQRALRMGAGKHDIYVRDLPPRRSSVTTILTDLDKLRRRGVNPRLVVIDYADRLKPTGRYEKEYQGQHEVYEDLASIAKEANVAIWTASQGTRESLRRATLNLQHIAGAYAKTWESTFVVMAAQDETMYEKSDALFCVAKARRGSAAGAKFEVKYRFATSRFLFKIKLEEQDEEEALPMSVPAEAEDDEATPEEEKFGS